MRYAKGVRVSSHNVLICSVFKLLRKIEENYTLYVKCVAQIVAQNVGNRVNWYQYRSS